MSWLKIVPAWCWWVLVVLLIGGVQQYRVMCVQSAFDSYRIEIAERDRRAEAAARAEERRRQQAIDQIDEQAGRALDEVQADADSAGIALERLRRQLAELEQRSRACGNSITTQLGKAAEAAARVQSELFAGLGEAARVYAAEADRRGVAGRACEAAYDALR